MLKRGSAPDKKKTASMTAGCLGASSGFLIGWGCLGFSGILLTLTGIGAILGIPLFLVGLVLPFCSGAIMARIMTAGKCPHCGEEITYSKAAVAMDCPICKQRLRVKPEGLFKIDI